MEMLNCQSYFASIKSIGQKKDRALIPRKELITEELASEIYFAVSSGKIPSRSRYMKSSPPSRQNFTTPTDPAYWWRYSKTTSNSWLSSNTPTMLHKPSLVIIKSLLRTAEVLEEEIELAVGLERVLEVDNEGELRSGAGHGLHWNTHATSPPPPPQERSAKHALPWLPPRCFVQIACVICLSCFAQ